MTSKTTTKRKNLLDEFPQIAAEWDYESNGELLPENVGPGSIKKVGWVCAKGHKWDMSVAQRTKLGYGCRDCRISATRAKNNLTLTHPNIAQEWDYEKNGTARPEDFTQTSNEKVTWRCKFGHRWNALIRCRTYRDSTCPECRNPNYQHEEQDLATAFPEIAAEWHPIKNGDLTPDKVASKSGKRVWWKCNTCPHEWQTAITNRTILKNACPECAVGKRLLTRIQRVGSLASEYPDVAREWDYAKNGDLKPENVTPKGRRIVHWVCAKGHEWEDEVRYRTAQGRGCPDCRVSLADEYPQIAAEWDYSENGDLVPEDVAPKSHKRVAWKCIQGHKWRTKIVDRTSRMTRCPDCVKESRSKKKKQVKPAE